MRSCASPRHCNLPKMFFATSHETGPLILGVLLMVIGLIALLDILGSASRYRSFVARFAAVPPLWAFRGVGLLGVLGGAVLVVLALH